MKVDETCEMKSESFGVLTRTTSTATIDCALVDVFQNLHSDKTWTVTHKFIAHVLVNLASASPTGTIVPVDHGTKPGAMIEVVQDPKSATHVQLASTLGSGIGLGVGMIIGGVVMLAFALLAGRRGTRMPPPRIDGSTGDAPSRPVDTNSFSEGMYPVAPTVDAPASPARRQAYAASAGQASRRTFGRR